MGPPVRRHPSLPRVVPGDSRKQYVGTSCPRSLPSVTGAGTEGSGQTGEEVARGSGGGKRREREPGWGGPGSGGRRGPGASRGPSRRSPVFKAGATVRGLIRTAVSRRRERWPGRSCRSGGFAVSKEKLFLSAHVCRGRLLCAHPEGPVALGMGTSGRRPEREAGPHSHLRELCHLLASPSRRSLHDCLPLPSPPPLKPVLSSGRCPLCSQCSGRFQLRLLH